MEKINIAELLKDCPKGMELDCTVYDSVQLDAITEGHIYPIDIQTPEGIISLSKYGCYSLNSQAKCVIFPKGKTTWEGFQRPFKDGDVVFYDDNIAIFKEWGDETLFRTYVTKYLCCDSLIDKNVPLFGKYIRKNTRLATEEEKQKLFNAIKANGYKWNPETKTLEKLTKFKVGDRIKEKKAYISGIITDISDGTYKVELKGGGVAYANIAFQDEWELVPNKFDITTLKPFESRVLVRSGDNSLWKPAIFGYYVQDAGFFALGGTCWMYCIPFENNEHLLGTTDDCDDFYKTWE